MVAILFRGLGGVVLIHTTFTPEMHHVRTRTPTPKQWFGFRTTSKN
jgi:hypothetical protein